MSKIVYPVHENPVVQEEIDRVIRNRVFGFLAHGSAWELLSTSGYEANVEVEKQQQRYEDRLHGALAVANAAGQGFKPAISTDDDLDGEELGPACSVDGEVCEACQ